MPRDLQELPRLSDRWSHIYLEHGRLEREAGSLSFIDRSRQVTAIPLDQFALILLGPGTTVTHAAMRLLADNNTLICWTGESGVRLYSHSTGGTHSARRLMAQIEAWSNIKTRLAVVRRMFQKRFSEELPEKLSLEQIRAMEGYRVRETYRAEAEKWGLEWKARSYDQTDWRNADPLNRALSAGNSCLYGICHAAILTAGYSAALGFVHTGKQLSFVYDIADLYKTELVIPLVFGLVKESTSDVERRARMACRDLFHEARLLKRVLPDIEEVLDVGHGLGEGTSELEGRAISLADGGQIGNLPGESELPNS